MNIAVSGYHNSPRNGNPNMAAALKLAKAGIPVFPVSQDRKPLVKWKDAATDDAAQVRRWWGRWPDAMPAMPTGSKSGISVLDLDMKNGKDGFAALRSLGLDPDTLSHVRVQTPSGGGHIYFRHRKGLTNSASKIADGVDVRGEGGYVHALGAVNGKGVFEVLDTHIADDVLGLPEWPDVLKPVRRVEEPVTPKAPDASDEDRAWARRELDDVCAALADAEPGGRNHALNEAAFRLGGVEALGLLDGNEVGFRLLAACAANGLLSDDGKATCLATINSGRKSGRKVPRYPPDPDVDLDEWFDDLDTPDALDAEIARILGLDDPTPPAAGKLTFRTPDDCAAETPRGYVVKGLIAPGQIGCIFGDPGAGKSLIAPSIGYAVAQGRETFGLRTKAAPVFYVAAEDEAGMGWRVRALRAAHGSAQGFKLVGGVSNLFAKDSPDLKELRQAVKRDRPGLIVIDTLAMAFPGMDENSAEGMGRVVAVARALTKWGAAVILIHHGTKAEGNTPRGHSLLNGALDMALHLTAKDQNGIVRGKLTKNRNGSCDLDIAFTIGVHGFGPDEDGDESQAAFAEELAPGAAMRTPSLSPTERAVLAVFARLADGAASVGRNALREAAMADAAVSSADSPASRKDTFNRALRGLVRKNLIDATGDQVALLRPADDLTDDFDDLDKEGTDP